jgi:hypothetical protein
VAGVGAVGALATYLTAVHLHVLPSKPLLIAYAFLLMHHVVVRWIAWRWAIGPGQSA